MKSSSSSQSGRNSSGHAPSAAPWLSPELLSMFQFHNVKVLPVEQEREIIQHKVLGQLWYACIVLIGTLYKEYTALFRSTETVM